MCDNTTKSNHETMSAYFIYQFLAIFEIGLDIRS